MRNNILVKIHRILIEALYVNIGNKGYDRLYGTEN